MWTDPYQLVCSQDSSNISQIMYNTRPWKQKSSSSKIGTPAQYPFSRFYASESQPKTTQPKSTRPRSTKPKLTRPQSTWPDPFDSRSRFTQSLQLITWPLASTPSWQEDTPACLPTRSPKYLPPSLNSLEPIETTVLPHPQVPMFLHHLLTQVWWQQET